jgi:hypothetical protein
LDGAAAPVTEKIAAMRMGSAADAQRPGVEPAVNARTNNTHRTLIIRLP